MNKITFIDTNRKLRARPMHEGGLRLFHRAPGAFRPARSGLACVWRVDPASGRLVACWSLEAEEDLTHWPRKSHLTKRWAGVAVAACAA
ncbi:MAG: hypothetical protein ABSE69_04290 [Roseiarcus sp.]|jgi:hypothetical protein